ncbi:hypothetical protein [Cytobacillus firmus]|uniref:Uncharacterized protein n=1 Tax=Cytobacillus firmus TaxID=1399 RepID=A0AA46SL01_CYTFI|nr:hypothetical protein [Cytobacillus firmus]UYG96744.1 hypothetical protein OD459_06860 [Cytobacillus firmus]
MSNFKQKRKKEKALADYKAINNILDEKTREKIAKKDRARGKAPLTKGTLRERSIKDSLLASKGKVSVKTQKARRWKGWRYYEKPSEVITYSIGELERNHVKK